MSAKVKTRFTTLDVTAMVTELKSKLIGMRINNIYDLNLKTYVFKLGKSEQKDFLILESGVRFHTTAVNSEKNKIPAPFTMKLRKYLRDKRLENIEQIGVERVVDFTFGRDENAIHIVLELYASGNLILTDNEYKILALLRSHEFTEGVKTAVGEVYPFEQAANLKLDSFRTDKEYIEQLINQDPHGGKDEETKAVENKAPEEASKEAKGKKNQKNQKKGQDGKDKKENGETKEAKGKEKAKKNVRKLKDILFMLLPCLHQAMVDQLLKDRELNPNTKAGEEHVGSLQQIAQETIEFLKAFPTKKQVGYLSYKETKLEEVPELGGKENVEPKETVQENGQIKEEAAVKSYVKYLEFSPIPLKVADLVKEIDSFDKAVDEFFTQQQVPDVQKGENDKKKLAWKKYENIKHDQETRMRKLKGEQDECLKKALLIETNLKEVDVIINIVGAMVQGGLGWDKIWKMVSESKNAGDPFASMISRLKLESDQAIILLKNPDEPEAPPKEVEVDIKMKAYLNAERYYQDKKKMEVKEKKTMEALQQALKLAEKAAMAEINHEKQKSHVLITRKTYWFEKFCWFITSENYLVLSGRDAQQNETLVKKYLKKGDLYMHADIHGAGSVIIKNPTNKPVPKITLEEASIFTVCRSKAWESKIITSAWWVYDHQVSKTAQSGEYLPTGSFMVRGKKNFLNPSRLEMGFGLLFKIDEACLARHENDRKVKYEEGEEPASAELPAPEQVQENDTYFITGLEAKPIISYDKSKQQQQNAKQKGAAKDNKPVVQQEERKVASTFNDEDDEEDEFKALRKGDKNEKLQKRGSVNDLKGEEQKLKNLVAQKVPRGKKTKIQKMKEKYGDQDEEEKELRLKLTGGKDIKELRDEDSEEDGGKKGKKKDKGKDKDKGKQKGGKQEQGQGQKQKQQQGQSQKGGQGNQGQNQNQNQQKKKPEGEVKVQIAETGRPEVLVKGEGEQAEVKKVEEKVVAEQKAEEKKEETNKDQEEERSSMREGSEGNETSEITCSKGDVEDAQVNEAKEEEETVQEGGEVVQEGPVEGEELRLLVSNPHPEDTILFCVPVCGPYVTLSNYKYKSKLVPGTLKKGKAVKTVMSIFTSPKDLPENEKKLMKHMSETELVNAMIGNVKVGAAGLLKIKEKEKKAKEQKKKEYRSQEKKNVDKK